MPKKLVIKGVGEMMARRIRRDTLTEREIAKDELITLGYLQNLRIDLNVEVEDIYGGDGMFPFDDIITSKSIQITATDAKFDLSAVQMLMGGEIETVNKGSGGYLWALNEKKYTDSNGVSDPLLRPVMPGKERDIVVRTLVTDKLLTYNSTFDPATDTLGSGEFWYDHTNNTIVVGPDVAGQSIYVNYMYEADVEALFLGANEIPITVSVVHHGAFVQKDGRKRGIETEIYAARPRGTFSIDTARRTANASSITLQLIDPERPDGRLGSIKVFEL